MPIEGDDDGASVRFLCQVADVSNHRLMAEVHPVVRTDGDDGTLAFERSCGEIGHDSHELRRYPLRGHGRMSNWTLNGKGRHPQSRLRVAPCRDS